MHKLKSFPLRIGDQDRRWARRMAQNMGLSENRLYSDLIQEGLLVREQMAYFDKCVPCKSRRKRAWPSWTWRRTSSPHQRTGRPKRVRAKSPRAPAAKRAPYRLSLCRCPQSRFEAGAAAARGIRPDHRPSEYSRR